MTPAAAPRPIAAQPPLCRAIDGLALGLAWMACAATASIVVLLTAEIVARSLFSYSFQFAWEYAAYCLGILIFGGLGWTLRTGGHIRVAVLGSVLRGRALRAIESVAGMTGALLATFLAVAMVLLCRSSFVDQSRSFQATETLLFVPQIFTALGAIGFALQAWLRAYLIVVGQPVEIEDVQAESPQSHL